MSAAGRNNRGSTATCASGRARTARGTSTTSTAGRVSSLSLSCAFPRFTARYSSRPPARPTDLRRLGQTTKVAHSTLNDVRVKIAELREKSAASAEKKQYDFEQRIKEIQLAEQKDKEAAREAKRRKREEERKKEQEELTKGVDKDMMAAMGFGAFGGGASAKR